MMGHFKFQQLKARLKTRWDSVTARSRKVDMSDLQEFYRQIWLEASLQLSANFEELAPGIWKVFANGTSTLISNFKVQMDNPVILNIAGHKGLTYRILMENHLPVPDHHAFECEDIRSARQFMERYPGQFFVIKPEVGTSGACGITTQVHTGKDLVSACALASLYGRNLLIERYIAGEPYRLLILDGKLIHASRRRGSWVVGDGRSSLSELQLGGGLNSFRNGSFLAEYSAQGVSPKTIPMAGQKIYLGSFAAGTPGDGQCREFRTVFNEDATTLIGPELAEQAIRSARALDSRFAGVDVLTLDPSVGLEKSGGVINEVNTTPGLHHHYNLANQTQPPAAVKVLRHLLGNIGEVSWENPGAEKGR